MEAFIRKQLRNCSSLNFDMIFIYFFFLPCYVWNRIFIVPTMYSGLFSTVLFSDLPTFSPVDFSAYDVWTSQQNGSSRKTYSSFWFWETETEILTAIILPSHQEQMTPEIKAVDISMLNSSDGKKKYMLEIKCQELTVFSMTSAKHTKKFSKQLIWNVKAKYKVAFVFLWSTICWQIENISYILLCIICFRMTFQNWAAYQSESRAPPYKWPSYSTAFIHSSFCFLQANWGIHHKIRLFGMIKSCDHGCITLPNYIMQTLSGDIFVSVSCFLCCVFELTWLTHIYVHLLKPDVTSYFKPVRVQASCLLLQENCSICYKINW